MNLSNRQIQNRLWKVAQGKLKPEDILKEGVSTTRLIEQTLVFIGSQGHFHECWCVEHLAEQVVMASRMDVSGVRMDDQKGMSRSGFVKMLE